MPCAVMRETVSDHKMLEDCHPHALRLHVNSYHEPMHAPPILQWDHLFIHSWQQFPIPKPTQSSPHRDHHTIPVLLFLISCFNQGENCVVCDLHCREISFHDFVTQVSQDECALDHRKNMLVRHWQQCTFSEGPQLGKINPARIECIEHIVRIARMSVAGSWSITHVPQTLPWRLNGGDRLQFLAFSQTSRHQPFYHILWVRSDCGK